MTEEYQLLNKIKNLDLKQQSQLQLIENVISKSFKRNTNYSLKAIIYEQRTIYSDKKFLFILIKLPMKKKNEFSKFDFDSSQFYQELNDTKNNKQEIADGLVLSSFGTSFVNFDSHVKVDNNL